MSFESFYLSLPKMKQVPDLYISGYTEVFSLLPYTRVIPTESFKWDFPFPGRGYAEEHTGFPCYLLPIIEDYQGKKYITGYVLKGRAKPTPRVYEHDPLPWYNTQSKVVFAVEGYKDSYLFLKNGLGVIPMLTAVPSVAMLEKLRDEGKALYMIPDNDAAGAKASVQCAELCRGVGLPFAVQTLRGIKDFGDYFDFPDKRDTVVNEFKSVLEGARRWLKSLTPQKR